MKYIINENNLKIKCKISEKEKTLIQCRECPTKKNCNEIENAIKKDIDIKNENAFKKFIYNKDCPDCKICMWGNKTKIENCKTIDKNCKEFQQLKKDFYNSTDKYEIDYTELDSFIKEIKK